MRNAKINPPIPKYGAQLTIETILNYLLSIKYIKYFPMFHQESIPQTNITFILKRIVHQSEVIFLYQNITKNTDIVIGDCQIRLIVILIIVK